jgi:hypothetical protein
MNAKQNDVILEALSRRKFLSTSSAALAITALAGATALGQERFSTAAAKHDHSSSDPGQENKPLLDENPDSNMPPPTDHGDMVPLWYSFDLVFLELLASDVFEDVSLNQWLRRLPAQMVQAHLGFDQASLAKIPDEKLDVV